MIFKAKWLQVQGRKQQLGIFLMLTGILGFAEMNYQAWKHPPKEEEATKCTQDSPVKQEDSSS